MQDIELYIDKLVLHGFSHNDRHRIGNAVKQELTRLLTKQDISSVLNKGGEISYLNAGNINIAQNSKAETIGNQVAGSVYKNINFSQRR